MNNVIDTDVCVIDDDILGRENLSESDSLYGKTSQNLCFGARVPPMSAPH